MKKNLVRWLIALALILPCLLISASAADASGTFGDGNNLTWMISSKTLTISGEGEMAGWSGVSKEIPWYDYRSSISTVTIGNGVTSIGDHAFYGCTGLKNVTIPNSVISIGAYAFAGCTDLAEVTIPDSVTSIGGYAFYGCTSLTTVSIPDSVLWIGDYAFFRCTGLTEVTLSDNMEHIGAYAFSGCTSLTEVTVPNSVTSIGDHAFSNCAGLTQAEFLGHAPSGIGASIFEGCNAEFKIQCYSGMTGWTDGSYYDKAAQTWYGYLLEVTEKPCAVTVEIPTNGTVEVNPDNGPSGTEVTITATPAEGHYLKAILVDGEVWSGNTFTMTGDHTVTAEFAELTRFYDGTNMVLGGTLDMNFYYPKTNIDAPGSYYAEIVHRYADDREADVQRVDGSAWKTSGDNYKIAYEGLAAKEMCDEIAITIYNANGTAISETKTDSVRDYVMRVLKDEAYTSAYTMLVDMLNYGAAAQRHCEYDTGNLADDQLTDEHQKSATQSVECTDERVVSDSDKVYGSSLGLENKIELNFYFTGVKSGMYAMISYTDYCNKAEEYRMEYTDFVKNNRAHKVSVDTLAVADGNTMVTCTVYNADRSVYAEVKDSMNSYLARFMDEYPLMESIAKFISSTHDYMIKNN